MLSPSQDGDLEARYNGHASGWPFREQFPPQRDAVHMLISINNGCQKSGLETWGREHLVLPREIREDFPQEGASEVVLGGLSRSLTGREQRKGMFQREGSAHKGLES